MLIFVFTPSPDGCPFLHDALASVRFIHLPALLAPCYLLPYYLSVTYRELELELNAARGGKQNVGDIVIITINTLQY